MNNAPNTPGTSNTGSTLMGFALGAVVGAGLALLLAPESGRRTRQRLASTARRWSTNAADALEQARDTVADLGTDAKSALKVGQDAFLSGRSSREARSERRVSPAGDPPAGLNAAKHSSEEAAR
jgi:gas vesicle protein